MAYVTIEEVAQYLADNGYTRWTDLSLQKVLTESGMWTRLQSNYDSTRAIDPRYITFPTVDLSAYATEAEMKSWVQNQGYLTNVPSPDLSSYATQAWVLGRGYLTSHQSLDDYATKAWVGMQTSSLASQVWVGNNFVSKATFDDLFEKVNIGTEQSPVYAIHAKLGLFSDSFISAGGVGSSGGGGGGSLTWDNLAAATTEQIALSHLTTALSGYLTSYGYRPQIGKLSSSGVTWLTAGEALLLPLTNAGAGNYQLDLSSYVTTGTAQTISGAKTFSDFVTGRFKYSQATTYAKSLYYLRADGGVDYVKGLFSDMSVSGSTLYVTVGGTAKSVTLPTVNAAVYNTNSAFRSAFPNVRIGDVGVGRCVLLAQSGNWSLVAITITAEQEDQVFYVKCTTDNKYVYKHSYAAYDPDVVAIVWLDSTKSYLIDC